jgi:hypothetical protein
MSTALLTITDYITDARTLLQDTIAPYRYDDGSLVIAMNVALLEGRRLRPDLFVFSRFAKGGVPSFQANDGTLLDIEEPFRLAFLHGLCAHALERDQEDIQDERSATFMKIFTNMLIGTIGVAAAAAQGG